MNSSNLTELNKKAQHTGLKVIIIAIILLIIAGVLIYRNVGAGMKAGIGCVAPGVGEGKCVASQEECIDIGIINPVATGCKGEKSFCCVAYEKTGKGLGETGTTTGSGEADEDVGDGEEESDFTGAMEFYCKCKIEDGYLVADENFNKLDIEDISKGGVDFKAKAGTEYEMQVRGTEDISYCKIKIVDPSKGQSGTCDAENNPILKHTFTAGDFDISLIGYDKKDGTQVASAVVDIKVE